MKALQNIKIKNKLFILVLLPIVGLLYFSVGEIMEKNQLSTELCKVRDLSEFAVIASALVHETQKERGATAGFLGSNGTKFVSELSTQHQNTDKKRSELKEFVQQMDLDIFSPAFIKHVNSALSQLDEIGAIRSKVSSLNIETKEAILYYTSFNNQVLSAIGEIAKLSSIADISNRAEAYTNFLKSKERAGIERAVLTDTFAANKFGPGMYNKLIQLITEHSAYADAYKTLATDDLVAFYNNTLRGKEVSEVQDMRQIAIEKGSAGQFNVDASYWFKTITTKINLLKKIENENAEQLLSNAEQYLNNANSSLYFSLIVSITLVITALGLTFIIVAGITKPICTLVSLTNKMNEEYNSFVKVVDAIANNDLTQKISQSKIESTGINSTDEIGQLVNSIELTLESKNKIGSSLDKMRLNLTKTLQNLNENTSLVAAAATEIASSAEIMSKGSQDQTNMVTQVSTAIEEITATIVESSNNSAEASQSAQSAAQTATEGGQIVSETIDGMQRISSVVSESAQSIGKLAESSNQIGEIIGVIDDIADQTNLLALNAAIEAARAGEQGRGFAVVADEVRKLAERTGTATNEITQMINSIQLETSEAVTSMETGSSEVDKGRELTDKAGNALSSIVTMSESVMHMIQQIAVASEQQTCAAEEIAKNIEYISNISIENTKGAEESSDAALGLSKQAEELKIIVEQFKI